MICDMTEEIELRLKIVVVEKVIEALRLKYST